MHFVRIIIFQCLCHLVVCDQININSLKYILNVTTIYHNFTNVPIFVGGDINQHELNGVYDFLNIEMRSAQYIFTSNVEDGDWSLMRNDIMDDIVSIIVCKSEEDLIWRVVDRRLRKLRKAKLIVVTSTAIHFPHKIYDLFRKLWNLQFLQTILLNGNTTYSYTPYPIVRFFPVYISKYSDPFPQISKDLMGYKIYTPVYNDIPRIFCSTDAKHNLQIGGFAYQIFEHFMERLNASLHITNPNVKRHITSSVNMSDILYNVGEQNIEISMHPYTGIPEEQGIIGYPIFKLRNCLIVPVQNEIPRSMYLVRPYEWSSWFAIFILMLLLPLILASVNYHNEHHDISYSQKLSRCFLESLSFLTFRTPLIYVDLPKLSKLIIYIDLTILGFLLTTYYSNLLSSFLTTFLVGDQIDSFEDMVTFKFPILLKYYEKPFLLQQVPDHLVLKVERLLVLVNASVQVSHLISFNRSYSYPVTEERWTFLALQQQYANKPIYRYSNICLGSPCVGYPMRLDSHLEHRMTHYIMDVQMAGLDQYWQVADFNIALKAGYMQFIQNELPFKAMDLDSVRVAFFVWIVGIVISGFTYTLEVYFQNKYKH